MVYQSRETAAEVYIILDTYERTSFTLWVWAFAVKIGGRVIGEILLEGIREIEGCERERETVTG